uniref:Uncharacterized protein n=1 Tax=Oryza punctata TaxID=4537 RepID=A0A0E0L6K4_ORYPU
MSSAPLSSPLPSPCIASPLSFSLLFALSFPPPPLPPATPAPSTAHLLALLRRPPIPSPPWVLLSITPGPRSAAAPSSRPQTLTLALRASSCGEILLVFEHVLNPEE